MDNRIKLNVYSHSDRKNGMIRYRLSTNDREIGYIHYQGNNNKVQGHYEGGTINTTSDKLEEVYLFVENGIKEMFDKYGLDMKIVHMFD